MHLVYRKTFKNVACFFGGRTFVSIRRRVFHHGPCWIMGDGIESGPMYLLSLMGF
jgi:hypothetical protein